MHIHDPAAKLRFANACKGWNMWNQSWLVLIGRLLRDAARANVRSRRAPGLGRNHLCCNLSCKREYRLLFLCDCSQVPSPVSSRCSYSFRNPLTLSLPSCRTSRRLKSFLPSSVALFNSLILCLSLWFVAPLSAHFCKLLISFFFLISFLTVCHRSQLFSHNLPSSP